MSEPLTRAQIEHIYDWAFTSAAQIVAKGKHVQPVALTARFRDTPEGDAWKFEEGKVIAFGGFETQEHKDRAARIIEQLIEDPRIDCVCFISEMWYIGPKDFDNPTREELEAAADAVKYNLLPSEHPLRREGVVFHLRGKLYDVVSVCPIWREPSNRLVQRPIQWSAQIEGRFARRSV